jgi:hypothetical protein
MKRDFLTLRNTVAVAILCAASAALLPRAARAQAAPGPMTPAQPTDSRGSDGARPAPAKPPVQPRANIFGGWALNRDDSDDPRKRAQESRGGGNGGGNRRMGGGYPGGGGGYGGRRMGGGQGMSDEDRQRMQELMTPANSMTLAEAKKDAEVDSFDDQERKRAFFTDGRKLQKSKDSNYQEIAAHWDGARLVTDEKNPRGGKMSRTYELSYDGTQLYETLHMTVGRNNTPLVVRFVYDQAPGAAAAAAQASAPPTSSSTPHQP